MSEVERLEAEKAELVKGGFFYSAKILQEQIDILLGEDED